MKKPPDPAHEQRLAAKLRENLKRRKQQARARATGAGAAGPDADGRNTSANDASLKPGNGSDS